MIIIIILLSHTAGIAPEVPAADAAPHLGMYACADIQ